MKVEIHSIRSIEKRAMLPFAPNTILISMGDTGAKPPRLNNKPDHILRLSFDDVTLEEARTGFWLPMSITSSDEKMIEYLQDRNIYLFSDEQARQIAEFVLEHIGNTDILICQCHYGQSRSAGCAAAIMEYFYGKGAEIFADYRYYPNRLVYQKVIEALEKIEAEK